MECPLSATVQSALYDLAAAEPLMDFITVTRPVAGVLARQANGCHFLVE